MLRARDRLLFSPSTGRATNRLFLGLSRSAHSSAKFPFVPATAVHTPRFVVQVPPAAASRRVPPLIIAVPRRFLFASGTDVSASAAPATQGEHRQRHHQHPPQHQHHHRSVQVADHVVSPPEKGEVAREWKAVYSSAYLYTATPHGTIRVRCVCLVLLDLMLFFSSDRSLLALHFSPTETTCFNLFMHAMRQRSGRRKRSSCRF